MSKAKSVSCPAPCSLLGVRRTPWQALGCSHSAQELQTKAPGLDEEPRQAEKAKCLVGGTTELAEQARGPELIL